MKPYHGIMEGSAKIKTVNGGAPTSDGSPKNLSRLELLDVCDATVIQARIDLHS